jgi:hypothetical protein
MVLGDSLGWQVWRHLGWLTSDPNTVASNTAARVNCPLQISLNRFLHAWGFLHACQHDCQAVGFISSLFVWLVSGLALGVPWETTGLCNMVYSFVVAGCSHSMIDEPRMHVSKNFFPGRCLVVLHELVLWG